MRVNKFLLPILGVVPMLGMILIAQLTGAWSTSGRAAVDMANMSPDDIKGWMTWQELSDGLGIPLDELYALSGVPSDIPPTTAMKEMEGLLEGFETTAVREVVAAYLAGATVPPAPAMDETHLPPEPIPGGASTPLPTPTATAPASAAEDSAPAQTAATPAHLPAGDGMGDGSGPTPLPAGQILPASEIKGRHTLAEIAQQAAVPLDALLAALNLPAELDPSTPIKDLVSSGALAEIQDVRDAVAGLQAAGQ